MTTLLGPVNVYTASGSLIGNFNTIQQAVDFSAGVAGSGKTIVVDGTSGVPFDEQVVVNGSAATASGALDGLTIKGINGAELQAPSSATLQSTAQSPTSGRDLDGVLTIENASGVTVTALTVDGDMQGANLASGQNNATEVGIAAINSTGTVINGVMVEHVRESDAGFGDQRGIAIEAINSAGNSGDTFTVENSTISDFQKGGIVAANAAVTITGNTVDGVVSDSQAQNGIQVGGSSGVVSGNMIENIGYTRNDGQYNGSGILEYDGSNLSIDSNKISLDGAYTTGVFAYNSSSIQNNVSVTNNTITGAGPTGAGLSQPNYSDGIYYQDGNGGSVSGNKISGFDVGLEVDPASTNGASSPTVSGNTFGASIGSAFFLGDGSFNPTPQQVIANSTFASPGHVLVTDSSGNVVIDAVFSTIQAAIDAASAGDVIEVGAGTYNESLNIDKAVTIEGVNAGVNGDSGARGAETVITGQSAINTTGQVTIDGVEFLDSQTYSTLSSSDQFTSLTVNENSTDGDIIENSVFDRAPDGDSLSSSTHFVGSGVQPTQRGLDIASVTGGQSITVENNLFTGNNSYTYAGDDWRSAIYSNGGDGTTTIAGNTFDNSRTAINADNFSSSVSISGNSFQQDGSGVSIGVTSPSQITSITGNTFANVDTTLNLQNLTTLVSFDGTATNNTASGEPFWIEGGTAGGTLKGTAGADVLHSNGGTTTFVHTGGGDTFIGSAASIDTATGYDASAKVSFNGTNWIVTDNGSTDTLDGVDKVTIGTQTYDLVDHSGAGVGGYQSIQAAIDGASSGDIVDVAAGSYSGFVNVDKDVTIEGANAGVSGPNASRGAETIISGGIEVTAAGATIDGAEIDGSFDSVSTLGTDLPNGLIVDASSVTIENSNFVGDSNDSRPFSTEGGQTGLDFENNLVQGWAEGAYIVEGSNGTIANNTFLADGNGVVSESTGVNITSNNFNSSGSAGAGADVATLIYAQDANITTYVNNNTYTSGVARPISAYLLGSDGQAVTGSDTPTTYHLEYHTGSATVTGGTGVDTISYSDATTPVAIDLTAGKATFGSSVTTFTSIENATGGSGNDTFVGDGVSSVLTGGGGTDTVDYVGATASNLSIVSGDWTITGAHGTDTLVGIDKVNGGGANNILLVGAGGYATIQAAMVAATAGDTVLIANGTYNENVALKDGVNVMGQSKGGVTINGTLSTPADFDDTTVSNLTVTNNTAADGMLLDMTATQEITDSTFSNDTFELTKDFTGAQAIGNGQVSGSVALNGDGLTFSGVTMNANNWQSGSTSFVYTLFHSVNGAQMVLDGVDLEGADSTGLGAQWNMSPNGGEISDVTIENSSTSGGGNFYISGMSSATITGNTFAQQGLALNGVTDATVTGNLFEDISDAITANGTQHRGLTIEDAWGAPADSNITISGNTFSNITALDGAIALQRFTDVNGNLQPATIAQLSDIAIEGNTFGAGVNPIYFNPGSFGAGSIIQGSFAGTQFIIGTSGNDVFNNTKASGNVTIFGGGGTDTATFDAGATLSFANGQWQVSEGGLTDALVGVDKVKIGDKTYDLVDHTGAGVGGYQSIQSAANGASAGDVIEIAGGTYNESVQDNVDNLTFANATGEKVTINSQGGYQGAITVGSGKKVSITGDSAADFILNSASGSNTMGLYLVGDNGATMISDVTVNAAGGSNALLTGGGENGLNVEGSTFGGTGSQLVYVNGVESLGPGNQDSNINFENNTFSGSATGPLLGIEANSGTLSGNTFSGVAAVGLGLSEAGMTVTGNTFGTSTPIYFYGSGGYRPVVIASDSFTGAVFYITGPSAPDAIFADIQTALSNASSGETIDSNGTPITLTASFAKTLEFDGVAVTGSSVTLLDTAADIEALTPAQIAGLAFTGVTTVTSSDDSIVLNVSEVAAFENAGLSVSVPNGKTVTVVDSATNVQKGLSALTAFAPDLSSITANGGPVTVSVATFLSDEAALDKIVGGFAVSDTAANIQANIGALGADASHIASITTTGGGIGSLSTVTVTVAQFNAEKTVLNKLPSGFGISDTAADIVSGLAALKGDVNHITTVATTDSPVTVGVTTFAADKSVLDKIGAGFDIEDQASTIASRIGALAADGNIDLITVENGVVTELPSIFEADKSTLDKITGGFAVSGTAAHISAALDQLSDANILSITISDNVAVAVTSAQLIADATTIGKLQDANASAVRLKAASLSFSAGNQVTIEDELICTGAFNDTDATLSLAGGPLFLDTSASFTGGVVDGTHLLVLEGATSVSGLTIGGSADFDNLGTATQSGGLTIGDTSVAAAKLLNQKSAIYDIVDNSGIGRGTSAGSSIANAGLFEKTGGTGTSAISLNVVNGGTLKVSSGVLDIKGNVQGTGTDVVSGAATLEFDGAVGAGQTVSFTGSNGLLDIGRLVGFAGEISGFDTVGSHDTLRIEGAWTYVGFTENHAGTEGTLTFAHGATDMSLILLGDYSAAKFAHSAGPSGSTLITYV